MIKTTFKLAMAGSLAIVASSQAEAQQAVSVPGTPGWGANSGYPAASPWRRPWPRVGNPARRSRPMTYQYPTAAPYQGYSAPTQGYYYYPSTPGYTQTARPVYSATPQPAYAPAAPATQPTAPTYAPAAPVLPGVATPGTAATTSADPSSQPIGTNNPSAGTGRDVSMHKPWMPPTP